MRMEHGTQESNVEVAKAVSPGLLLLKDANRIFLWDLESRDGTLEATCDISTRIFFALNAPSRRYQI
ncbi:hypothetical protein Hypma_010554 [Hypsizygus marmoreus]|uniref:Uncharacterized protein n=1 Tax=Hypsizygus marmoreus TaxID=39966 RepID=A0A369JKJ1_HYPMA|nr:hypothetical protein Hypma_010554 [Hypsizygus marmoreus]